MVDWLYDLSRVPNGAIVLISCTRAPPAPKPAAAVVVDTTASDGDGAEQQAYEDGKEALALAALRRIRESYRTRAKKPVCGRSDEFYRRVGKRMMDKRRELERTAQSRKASYLVVKRRLSCHELGLLLAGDLFLRYALLFGYVLFYLF